MADTDVNADSGAEEALKKAEQRGYSKGYQAGRRRIKLADTSERQRREQQAFFDKAMLAALPACIEVNGWRRGDEPITDVPARVKLAVSFANEALKQRRIL